MTVRALTVKDEDVALYRAIRLDALQADPAAFASSYEREAAFDDAKWKERLTGLGGREASLFIDEVDGKPVGTAGIAYTEWDAAPMLVAMWVRPEARGNGCGRRLVSAAVAWAKERDEADVVLWVVKDNAAAISLYTACGFVASGQTDTLPSNPCVEELEMRYSISPGRP